MCGVKNRKKSKIYVAVGGKFEKIGVSSTVKQFKYSTEFGLCARDQVLANIFYKGPDSTRFGLCRPRVKISVTMYLYNLLKIQRLFLAHKLYKTRQWAKFGQSTTVCQLLH